MRVNFSLGKNDYNVKFLDLRVRDRGREEENKKLDQQLWLGMLAGLAPSLFLFLRPSLHCSDCDSEEVVVNPWDLTAEEISTALAKFNNRLRDMEQAIADLSQKQKETDGVH